MRRSVLLRDPAVLLMLVIIFSPYVYPSIRVDHILLVLLFFRILMKNNSLIHIRLVSVLICYYCLVLLVTIYELLIGAQLLNLSPILDSFEWYLRGAIIFLFVGSLRDNSLERIIRVSKIYVLSGFFIGLFAIAQMMSLDDLVKPISSLYATNQLGRDLSNINGRYSSILGQPVSYGIYFFFAFNIMLFYGNLLFTSPNIRFALMGLITIFSSFSVSKAVIIGIPLIVLFRFYLLIIGKIKPHIEDAAVAILACITVLYLSIVVDHQGTLVHITNAYAPENISSLKIINTGLKARFGDDGHLSSALDVILDNIFLGVGWADHQASFSDSGYIPILIRGGLIGFFVYMLYVISIIKYSAASLRVIGEAKGIFFAYLAAAMGSLVLSVGAPFLYTDRSSDFFWIISSIAISIGINKRWGREVYPKRYEI